VIRIAVVGAGAAGTLVALHLLRHAATGTLHLTLIDPDRRTGPGVPYRTTDPRHLLNVPAGKLSVTAAEPADFVAWLAENGVPEASPEDFAPRELFGRYLSSAFEGARGDRVTRVHHRAVAVARHTGGLSVALCNGDEVHADTVVLAAGPNTPGTSWAPDWLRRSALFVSDPWRAGVLDNLPEDGDLLLVGTGLTLSTGQVFHARAVINCTGPQYDLTAGADRLWSQLLADGLARPGPLNLGLDTDTDGRLLPGVVPMWAIGPLRRGNLWETTAFVEIRAQAERLAALIGS
jgi:uncharacterized NAD(P)/FAD-binding protein YdhS